jgi:hypothetical protein
MRTPSLTTLSEKVSARFARNRHRVGQGKTRMNGGEAVAVFASLLKSGSDAAAVQLDGRPNEL